MNFSQDMKSLKNRRKGKAGFTMSELLIVVAIVIVLFAVAVLACDDSKESAPKGTRQ